MNGQMIRWLLKCYPARWRAEYGRELEDLLSEHSLRPGIVCDVLWSAVKERARQPVVRLLFLSLLESAGIFSVALMFVRPMWHLVSAPAGEVLRLQGFRPPNLVALTPWEPFAVVYLGIPLLVTALCVYPCSLLLAWRGLRTKVRLFAVWSAAAYVLGFLAGFLAWRNGLLGMLLHFMPDVQTAPMVSISHCFNLFAASTLGAALLLQIPIVAAYGISGAIQKTHRNGHSKHP
jgi:Sec-independent protein secretion pathway component TatC